MDNLLLIQENLVKHLAVYTALFDPYDNLQPAPFDDVDFVCFTDQNISPPGWKIRKVELPVRENVEDRVIRSTRYYFNQSHLVLPEYKYTIMQCANTIFAAHPTKLLDYLSNRDMAVFAHPHRSNVYQEGEACAKWHKDHRDVIEAQMERYRRDGFPDDYPLSTCLIVVRRNTPKIAEFEKMWWEETQKGSRRNQLSFDYCRWKLGIEVNYIPGDCYKRHDILRVSKHNFTRKE